jgi:hypothetical protein
MIARRVSLGITLALAAVAAFSVALVTPGLAFARPAANAGATKSQAKQIVALESLTRTLAAEVSALESDAAHPVVTPPASHAPESPPPPSVLPFSAPAGGAFTGTFPDPRLAPASVGTVQLTPDSVTSSSIADGSLTCADLTPNSFAPPVIGREAVTTEDLPTFAGSAAHMLQAIEWPGPGETTGSVLIETFDTKNVQLSCPEGFAALSGGWEWSNQDDIGPKVLSSHPHEPNSIFAGRIERTWEWTVELTDEGSDDTFLPKLLCLPA